MPFRALRSKCLGFQTLVHLRPNAGRADIVATNEPKPGKLLPVGQRDPAPYNRHVYSPIAATDHDGCEGMGQGCRSFSASAGPIVRTSWVRLGELAMACVATFMARLQV